MLNLLKKLFTKKKKTVADYCIQKHLDKSSEVESPCGRFTLRIDSFKTGKGTWNYTRGTIIRKSNGKTVAKVHRNYSHFVYSWIRQEDKTFLLTGEHYQGQTVVDCQTREISTIGPDKTDGWCWGAHEPSPDGKLVAVSGCYWACPYHWRIFDFSNPLATPLPEIDCDYLDHFEGEWIDEKTFANREYRKFCKETGVEEWDLPSEERKRLRELAKENGDDAAWRTECAGERIVRIADGKAEVEETIVLRDEDEEDED